MEFAFDETGQMYFIIEESNTQTPIAEAEDVLIYPKEADYLGVDTLYIAPESLGNNPIKTIYHEEVEDAVQP